MRYGAIEDSGMMDQPYFTVPIWRFVQARIGWLLILFLGQTLTGSVLKSFSSELETLVALSFLKKASSRLDTARRKNET
jgi:magnesium transporter